MNSSRVETRLFPTNKKTNIRDKQRVIAIDLDAITDNEGDTEDNESDTELSLTDTFIDISTLDKSVTESEMDLIDEVLKAETQELEQIIVDPISVEQIKTFLKSDSNDWNSCGVASNENKPNDCQKSKSKKKLIKRLKEENHCLNETVTQLKEQLDLKTRQMQDMIENRPPIICFKCGSKATEEYFGCYGSDRFKANGSLKDKESVHCVESNNQDNCCSHSKNSLFSN